ncbi:hypothetical protein [Nocardia sp. NPDC057668]|uniref:hypothetical protein n=1 Tax=Nocardia sp. NPDC057668 TaxID=3346202 RepID=UPI00366FA996
MLLPWDGRTLRGHVPRILFGLCAIALAVMATFAIAESLAVITRATGISGVAGTFVSERCDPDSGRRAAVCTGTFAADRNPGTVVPKVLRGGPYTPGTRVPVRSGADLSVTGSVTAATGLGSAAMFTSFVLLMLVGAAMSFFKITLIQRFSRVTLYSAAILFIGGVLIAVAAALAGP